MQFITLRGQIDSLPTDMDYVVCREAAAALLGLTTIRPPLCIFSNYPMLTDPDIQVINCDTLENIEYVKIGDVKCTSIEQTIIDLLEGSGTGGSQAVPESILIMLMRYPDKERVIEEYCKDRGLLDKYLKCKEIALDW